MLEDNNQENSIFENPDITKISGMYKEWFLDYASYVILERAVPSLEDGLKPVQRRILHSMKELDDGRYNKVANLVGNTMKYHPHGDASIADAMVQLGQKDLLIDTQGNWGNIFTGDRAAASRYIEARLSPFAKDVIFNKKTTIWQKSYDGRNDEPINLPVKFPLLLTQGVEGIAVGLSTKVLPHNFVELIDSSIKILQGKNFEIYPDFITGGFIDVSNYNEGKRGGKVKVRANINIIDNKTLSITEIPFGVNTTSLIDSILKANDKGKIKVQKVEDNTAENVEIIVYLPNNISAERIIGALYAFTDCEISISTMCCVIENEKPLFSNVKDLLKISTDNTVSLLKQELEIKLSELQEQWHFSSLEKIFIENKIYRDFEGKTYEDAIKITHKKLEPHIKHLIREVTDEDVKKLLEIRMRRITKHDSDKADELLINLENGIKEVKNNLNNLINFSIDYFKTLKTKYKKGKERKTTIKEFGEVDASKVVIKNAKLYVDKKEGFVGTGMKKAEYLFDCSDLDDIIIFTKNGKYIITKVSDKTFIGKDIISVEIFNKSNKRHIYNVIYKDGKTGFSYIKRFNVSGVVRDKEYNLTQGTPKSKVLHFTFNKNAEAEIVNVKLKEGQGIRKLDNKIDFADLDIKGRGVRGNIVSKLKINKVLVLKEGKSTIENPVYWFNKITKKLNTDSDGELLGDFNPEDKILIIYKNGIAKTIKPSTNIIFDDDILLVEKWDESKDITLIYFDSKKASYFVKKFKAEKDINEKVISDTSNSYIHTVTTGKDAFNIKYYSGSISDEIIYSDKIELKKHKAIGKLLTKGKIRSINILKKK